MPSAPSGSRMPSWHFDLWDLKSSFLFLLSSPLPLRKPASDAQSAASVALNVTFPLKPLQDANLPVRIVVFFFVGFSLTLPPWHTEPIEMDLESDWMTMASVRAPCPTTISFEGSSV